MIWKWNNEKKLAETALLVNDSTPRIHSEASKDRVLSACTLPLVVEGVLEPRPQAGLLNLKFLIVYSIQKYCKWSKPGGAQGLGTMLQAYNYSRLICLVSWARNEIWSCMGFAPLLSAWIGLSNDIRFAVGWHGLCNFWQNCDWPF